MSGEVREEEEEEEEDSFLAPVSQLKFGCQRVDRRSKI